MSPPSSSKGLAEFVAEGTEILDALSGELLALDEARGDEPDPELLNAIFRAAHSLKGLSGMFGQDRIAQLAHAAEDLLDRLRLGKVGAEDAVFDALIASLDVFGALLAEAAHGTESPEVTSRARELARHLARLSGESPDTSSAPEQTSASSQRQETAAEDPLDELGLDASVRAVLTEYEEHRLRENARKGLALWKLRAAFDLSDFDTRLAELNARLKGLGELISTLPSAEPGMGTGIAFDLLFGAKCSREELETATEGRVTSLVRIGRSDESEPVRSAAVSALPPSPLAPAPVIDTETSLRSLTQTVRVDIARLDGLMNAVGELLLIRANLQRLADGARQGATAPKLLAQELQRETRQLERKLDELQKGILDVRMVPLGQVFDKLARLVRRIARESGKEIDFVITGGEVELDKLIVEELSDPLMHIIRNAIDHGVEAPDVRAHRGKPRRATISLRAVQQGNHVVIEVRDDGPGVDEGRVKEVAISRDLITAAQASELSRRDLLNLVFLPGFSTARSVSELSGRGVGLDVVKTNIAHLSGIIDLHSEPGRGTTFAITLPLTLAIIRALVVQVSGRTYAVPLNSVLEILSVHSRDIRTVERREILDVRGQTLPLARLSRLFALPERPLDRHYVVVVGLAQDRLGIAVDELLGQQDIVTKPLGGRLQHVRGVSGATDLGNRRTVLVLDVGALVEEVLATERRAEAS